MSVPVVAGVTFGTADPTRPLLLLGPSLGTSAVALWGAAGAELSRGFHVVAWDLPGHGNSPATADSLSIAELAQAVVNVAEETLAERGEAGGSFAYAGDSVGGAVGLQILLDHPGRISSATLLCTGAAIGTPAGWAERAELVRSGGTTAYVEQAEGRWFAPGFIERQPVVAAALLQTLRDTDSVSYALACAALGEFDVRSRLHEIATPVLAVGGAADQTTPVELLKEIAAGVRDGRLVVLDDVAHLAPAEAPARVAKLISAHSTAQPAVNPDWAAGMKVRREVLGDPHVDLATANSSDFTRDFQDLITQYAWGKIWTRPGLDRRSRSLITLTALVARGHHEELALHLRAALRNGLTQDEIKELLLQAAIYCGVPAANTAFRIAKDVLDDIAAEPPEEQ